MPANRALPTPEAADLISLVRDLCINELAPRVAEDEATAESRPKYPRLPVKECRGYENRPAKREG